MVNLYVRATSWLAGLTEERGDVAVEYVVLVAVIGAAVLAGATLFRGAVEGAFNRLTTLVNGVQ
jgi:Flp pilus assembly pilin Flp